MNRRRLIITIASLFTLCAGLFAVGDTYIYDVWNNIEKSPDVYRVVDVIYAEDFGLDKKFSAPANIFCNDNKLFVVDSGNNRIIEAEYTASKKIQYIRTIDSFNAPDGIVNTFANPTDVFVNKDGSYFIADRDNGRVVKLDKDLNYLLTFIEPDDATYEKGKTFLPEKVVADAKGRAYVLARNVNKGFIKYEDDGTFTGFYGASEVTYEWTDYIWKKFSTRAQRDQMESFVPTEYSGCYMDPEGFIYATVKTFKPWELLSDQAKPIRRLNALGDDILIKDEVPPVGDLQWGTSVGLDSPSHFNDVTVLENDIYVVVDENRGRIFGYNNQGYLLYAFSNSGNIEGFFRLPAAVDHINRDLFVLDQTNASVTVFTPTKFGHMIYDATDYYAKGEYDKSAAEWEQVLKLNGNYDLAYEGLGKSYLRQNKYKEAMEYFKTKRFRKSYSKAFMYYRKEWIEAHLGAVMLVLCIIIFTPFIVKFIRNFVRELKSL
ncbi:MAG: tetratricopeptide repeat protein [Treponema sp.]|nr:tetratricopeptide repeat protein [Treponema sp.]